MINQAPDSPVIVSDPGEASGPALVGGVAPNQVLAFLLAAAGALAIGHYFFVIALAGRAADSPLLSGLRRFMNLGGEANLPTFWSVALLAAATVMLGMIAAEKRLTNQPYRRHWQVLVWAFAFMCVDEAAQIHDGLVAPAWRSVFGDSDGYVWYYPFIPVVLIGMVAFVRFLQALPRYFAILFVVAGGLYVGGALLIEMVESSLAQAGRADAIRYSQLVEESFEILGISVFVYALMRYVAATGVSARLSFDRRRSGWARG